MSSIEPIPTLPDHLDLQADWPAIEGRLERLLEREVPEAELPAWLEEWSDLNMRVGESIWVTYIENSRDTTDPDRKAAYHHVIQDVWPRLRPIDQRFKQRLLASGYDDESLATTLQRFRSDAEIYRQENVALLSEEQTEASRYDDIAGSLTAELDGKSYTISQLQPLLADPRRERRREAWLAGQSAFEAVAEELDELYQSLLPIRRRIAENAGFENYRDFKWRDLGRFDYAPEDALRMHEAIAQTFVPALERRAAKRAETLGLDALRPWDVEVDLHGTAALKPFESGRELAEGSARIFDRVGPVFGQRVRQMDEAGLLDLENRKGKAPGGYCMTLPARGMPFIFMNSVGTDSNLKTMLHEAGHAFHAFEAAARWPLIWQRRSPMEFAEVASMAMELLAAPYIERDEGGFYDNQEAVRSRVQHLERMLFFMPYMATVSAFQHQVYTEGVEEDRQARHERWSALHRRFCVGVDWSDFEAERGRLWHQKLHIFRAPFYYIEYGIAQLGALQVWKASRDDHGAALRRYQEALALGGTRSLPELFDAAGAELIWDAEPMAELVALIESELEALESTLDGD